MSRSRATRIESITEFFLKNLGQEFRTDLLHLQHGTSYRARVSEINRDPLSRITIHNRVERLADGREASWYWATRRTAPTSPSQELPRVKSEAGDTLFDITRDRTYQE